MILTVAYSGGEDVETADLEGSRLSGKPYGDGAAARLVWLVEWWNQAAHAFTR